ncbi:DUF2125 domain-containing protein [Pelagibacterium montanilacus]|uniref:DUF2125 domain-containing protein n=1 Tax=Pelagibacterium montanilacus TaxID=2185280 RepID=UPI000F8D2DE8|nr:DUF2125 domain-containing protein [Pelagibacterium montanilacus]
MKRFVIVIIIVLAVCALWAGVWLFVASQIDTELAALESNDGVMAPRLECETRAVRGFPFQFAPRCEGARITSGDITLAVNSIYGTALIYRPTHMQLFAEGPAEISDAFTGSRQQLDWESLRASLRLSGSTIERFSVVGEELVWSDLLFGDTVLGAVEGAEIHLVEGGEGEAAGSVLDLFVRLEGAGMGGLQIANGQATLDGQLTAVPEMALWGDPRMAALWQANGGVLTVRALDAVAEGLSLSASGEMALDDNGLLMGSAEVQSQGVVERFGDFSDDPMAAMLLGRPDDEGVYSQTLSARGGQIFIGLLPMATVPPVF